MSAPEFPVSMSPTLEAPVTSFDESMNSPPAILGALVAPSLVLIGQFVEPMPLLTNIVSSWHQELGVLSASAAAGGLLVGAGNFVGKRISQWRQQRSVAADVENIMQGVDSLLAEHSPTD